MLQTGIPKKILFMKQSIIILLATFTIVFSLAAKCLYKPQEIGISKNRILESGVEFITAIHEKPTATLLDTFSLLKTFIVLPGTTTATLIDSKNHFFVSNGNPSERGSIQVNFNGSRNHMAPGNRRSFKNENNENKYFIYKGVEGGKFVFYIQDYEVKKNWTGTSAPDTAKVPTQTNYSITPGATSAVVIDRMNEFFISNGNPDKYGRIRIRFNGSENGMAPGTRYSFKDENDNRKYFVYKGFEEAKFLFFLQDYE